MDKYNLGPSKIIMAGILLCSHVLIISCCNSNSNEQTVEQKGKKPATYCDSPSNAFSDNVLDTLPEEMGQKQGDILKPRYVQAVNRPTEYDSCTDMISGENGAINPRLLEYIDHSRKNINVSSQGPGFTDINTPRINVLLREPDYTSSKIDANFYNKSSAHFFLEEEGRLKLIGELKKYCEWKERSETTDISSRLENTLENEAIYKSIKEKIDKGLVPKSSDQRWKEVIGCLIDSYKDYGIKNYNINEPSKILAQVCNVYVKWHKALLKRFQKLESLRDIYSFYCEKKTKDRKDPHTHQTFLAKLKNPEFIDGLVDFYIKEKLKRLPPWEEINSILEKYGLPYKVDYRIGTDNDAAEFTLMKSTQEGITKIDLKLLSLEEKLILNLMSWLFYFPELSSSDEEPVQTKNIVIVLLCEISRQLDADLRKKLDEIIQKEFIQKRQISFVIEVIGDKNISGNSKL